MKAELVGEIRPTLEPGNHPFMTGPFTPNYREYNATDLEVIGAIPERLNGVYLRNTQNPVHQPLGWTRATWRPARWYASFCRTASAAAPTRAGRTHARSNRTGQA